MTKHEKDQALREIREAKRRLDARVSDDVKRIASNLADRYDSDLRKLAET